jgi:low temperature requirement protein LtrA
LVCADCREATSSMQLWRSPILREAEHSERRVTWIELFFDLAFVALVGALSNGLARDIGFDSAAEWMLLFSSMWAVWRYGAIYADRFETDDVSYRLSLLGLMAAVVIMAVSAAEGFRAGFQGFGIGYIMADLIILTLWRRGGHHNPRFRPLAARLTVAHAASISFWAVAVAVNVPYGWALAAMGTGIDLLAPLVTTRQQDALPPLSSTHLPERFGTFTIIVLGEVVLSIVSGLSKLPDRTVISWVAGACALLLLTGFYWLYFDQVMSGNPPATAARRNLEQYLHLPLTMAIAAISAVVAEFVDAPLMVFSTSSRLLFGMGVATALASIALLESLMVRDARLELLLNQTSFLEGVGAIVIAAVAIFVPGIPALVFALVCVAVVLAVVARGAAARARRDVA